MWSRLSPSGEADIEGSSRKTLLWALAALTLFRLVVAALIPLTEDEAYYRLWAMRPQLGYYDHPPMIAWWIALGRMIAGDDALGVRLLPVLGGTAVTILLWDTARLAGASERIAARAAVWLNATLLIGFGVILAVPDVPSTLFWTATLWALLKARGTGKPVWWLAAGVTAGLATLSKYSALFLAPGVFLWLAFSPEGRAELRRPWPWLTGLIAAALFGLNVWWNADHHWESFIKQFGRAAPGAVKFGWLGELLVGQFILINPLIGAFAWKPFDPRRAKAWGADVTLFVATVIPFAAYLVLHSLHARVQAHWPAPLYPALALLGAIGVEQETAPVGSVLAWLKRIAIQIGIALLIIVLASYVRAPTQWLGLLYAGLALLVAVALGTAPEPISKWLKRAAAPLGIGLTVLALAYGASGLHVFGKKDPSLQLLGWPGFAGALETARTANGAAWVGTLSYGVAGQLAARPEIKAPVLQLMERERYVFLPPTGADLTRPGLVVDLARREGTAALLACFQDVKALPTLQRGPVAMKWTTYSVWLVGRPRRVTEGGCDR
jgi:4-amino-4-deoxy-L-arabinose transferase-like glycosyltransferase